MAVNVRTSFSGIPGTKKAANQNRTGDLILTKDAHYRLCYSSLYWGLTRNEEIISYIAGNVKH